VTAMPGLSPSAWAAGQAAAISMRLPLRRVVTRGGNSTSLSRLRERVAERSEVG